MPLTAHTGAVCDQHLHADCGMVVDLKVALSGVGAHVLCTGCLQWQADVADNLSDFFDAYVERLPDGTPSRCITDERCGDGPCVPGLHTDHPDVRVVFHGRTPNQSVRDALRYVAALGVN